MNVYMLLAVFMYIQIHEKYYLIAKVLGEERWNQTTRVRFIRIL